MTSSRAAPSTPASAAPPRPTATTPSRSSCSAPSSGPPAWCAATARRRSTPTTRPTRLTPQNPAVPNPAPPGDTPDLNPFTGEIDGLAMAKDGRVFYAGRAVCFQDSRRSPTGTCRTSARAAARSTCGIPNVAGSRRPEPGQGRQGRRHDGLRRQGRRLRVRPDLQGRAGHPRHHPRPGLHQRAPVHLRPVPPVLQG